MNTSQTNTPIDDLEKEYALPQHPLFDTDKNQASFSECIDVIDRVRSIIALYDFLEVDDDRGGLSTDATFGCYWINTMNRDALSYVSDRLMTLYKKSGEIRRQESASLSALSTSLSTLDNKNRERFLNCFAAQLNITRNEIEQYVDQRSNQ